MDVNVVEGILKQRAGRGMVATVASELNCVQKQAFFMW